MSDGRSYTYAWSDRGEMLAEETQGVDVRTFTWDAAGRLVEATVFTLTTWFTYTGDGARVAVAVEGVGTTTYIPDRGGRILIESTATTSTRYLYGRDCLGEIRDGTLLYYLADGQGYVRQATDEDGAVVDAWLFTPDGGVMAGPQGPVSHLVCGGVYDWSTGLLYKGGRYFDPTLGIWLALGPLVVAQGWRERKKKGRRGMRGYVLVALLVVGIGGMLAACGPPGPWPTPTPCVDVQFVSLALAFNTGANTPWLLDRDGRQYRYLALGTETEDGVEFTGQALVSPNVMDESGLSEFHWLQVAQEDREREFEDGFVQRRGHGIGDGIDWMLDTADPYEVDGPVTTPGLWTVSESDKPACPLELGPGDTKKHGELLRVTVRDRYRMYLMWSPQGLFTPERATLGAITWGWTATVQRENPGAEWSTPEGYPDKEAGYATSEIPVWRGNVAALNWEPWE